MGIFIALILGIIAFGNIADKPKNTKVEEKKIQINDTKPKEVEPSTIKSTNKIKKKDPIKEEIKPEPAKQEPIKEEVKPEPAKQEPIKEEVKPELNQEDIEEKDSANGTGTSWLRLALYILGPVLVVVLIKYFYSKLKNSPSTRSPNNYFRSKFKEEVQTDNTEQQPAQEEVQTDNTEQQPAQEEGQTDNTEQQPAQEEDEDNNKQ